MKIGLKEKKIFVFNGVNRNDLSLMLAKMKYTEMRICDDVGSLRLGSWIRVFRALVIS